MNRVCLIGLVVFTAVLIGLVSRRTAQASPATRPASRPAQPATASRPAQETHKDTGVIQQIDAEKRTFTMEMEVEKDGQKVKISQNYIWHDVKDKYFKDLKPGDKVEVTWYNKAKDVPIAAMAKLLQPAATRPASG